MAKLTTLVLASILLFGCFLLGSYCLKLTNLADPGNKEIIYFKAFLQFIQKYEKKYDHDIFERKYLIFKENYDIIENWNNKSPNKVFGINKFADMTQADFRKNYLMPKGIIKPETRGQISSEKLLQPKSTLTAPDNFDWRTKGAITPVKNQESCGSCWAFSVTENVESVWLIAGHGDNETLELSPQQIVDCDTADTGCDGGDTPTAFQYIIDAGGLESESDYPYNADDNQCSFDKTKVQATISSYKYATQNADEKTMKSNLVSMAPLSICVDAARWQFYSGGVFTKKDCGNDLDHCTQLVGYDGDKNYWIVRNSWGPDWGIDGYIYLQMGTDTCGCADEATSAMVN